MCEKLPAYWRKLLAWLSGKFCNVFPEGLASNRLLMRGLDYPVVGTILSRTLRAGECCGFWEYQLQEFQCTLQMVF